MPDEGPIPLQSSSDDSLSRLWSGKEMLMIDTLATGIGLFGFIAMIGLFGWLITNGRKKTALRVAACEARGWRYTALGRGFTVQGERGGVPWTVTLTVRPNSDARATTSWEAPAEETAEIVLIGPKLPSVLPQFDFGGAIMQKALSHLIGDNAQDMVGVKQVHSAGSSAFNEHFMVVATTPEQAESFIDRAMEEAMMNAKEHFGMAPAVLRWRNTVQVRLRTGTWSPEDIDALVTLGVVIIGGSNHGKWMDAHFRDAPTSL